MKNVTTLLLILIGTLSSYSQAYSDLGDYKFESVESYKAAEPQVLECANFLFNTPAKQEELKRANAKKYILNWMQGTPDYTFELGNEVLELTKGNPELLGLYMAAMSKLVIENSGTTLSSSELYNKSEKLLVEYCANENNEVKPSKKIKKLIKSN